MTIGARSLAVAVTVVLLLISFASYASAYQNVTQMIAAAGYNFENHFVQTEDGYILQVQRILPPNTTVPYSRAIFLQHGLLDSATTWIINGPGVSLAYLLVDAGWDVWLGNARGNSYSLQHTTLNPDQDQFWQFSWDEMAHLDLPACIAYVKQQTGVDQIAYVGHSQGTETAFALFSDKAYTSTSQSVRVFVALAPVIFLGHMSVPVLVDLTKLPPALYETVLGHKAFLASASDLDKLLPVLCTFTPNQCEDVLCYLAGCENVRNINESNIPLYLEHFPAGTSVQNMIHYIQSVRTNLFEEYDFGTDGNRQHYNGSATPPQYTPQNLMVPTIVYAGGFDTLADVIDWSHAYPIIPPPLAFTNISDYGHGDFVWGHDAPQKVYYPLIQQLESLMPRSAVAESLSIQFDEEKKK